MATIAVRDLVRSYGAVRAVEIDAAYVRSLIAEDAELGRELESRLLAVAADRLQAARNRLVELYAYPGDHGGTIGPGRM